MRIALFVSGLAWLAIGSPIAAQADLVERPPHSAQELTLSFAPLVREAAPAVVNVHAGAEPRTAGARGRADRRRWGGQQRASALGSGVIVDPSGLVVTNAHVLGEAREARVSLNDRREFAATLLLRDRRTDLAILRIEAAETFAHLPFGDPQELEVGDLVLAIGNPFGVGQTVTQGIVSALARTELGISDDQFFIQTDAAINPGNSGGALIDMSGRLVGINTAIYSRSGGSNGIGFAIPADMVRIVTQSAREGRSVRRPWFGARLKTVTRELAKRLDLDRPAGAVVVEVADEGPASRAGLRRADTIVRLDDIPVADRDTFGYLFATRGTSGITRLTVMREGEPMELDVTLAPPPESVPREARRIEGASPFTGALAMNLSPAVADELGLPFELDGVVIARVDPISPARRVGLRAGDRIVHVNGWAIGTTSELEEAAAERVPSWDIIVDREGRELNLLLGG